MENNNLKNIVVLKNLPSNLIEEAFVILKPNKKIKTVETMNKKQENKQCLIQDPKEYIVKEAEMVISNYISNLEKTKSLRPNKMEQKYRRLKLLTYSLGAFSIISLLIHIII